MVIKLQSILSFDGITKRKVYTVIVLIVVLVTILEIWSSNRLATYGEQISKLEEAKTHLMTENNLLENQVEKETSLIEIDRKSKELGFDKTKAIKYIQNFGLALNK